MTVIISNQRITVRLFSISSTPISAVRPTYRHLGKALGKAVTRSSYLADESDDMPLNPYSRAFFLLWLVASVVAVGVHYL